MDGDICATATTPPDSDPARKRRVHGMLKLYYGLNEEGKTVDQAESMNPCDINGTHFDPEVYLNKVKSDFCVWMRHIVGYSLNIRQMKSRGKRLFSIQEPMPTAYLALVSVRTVAQ